MAQSTPRTELIRKRVRNLRGKPLNRTPVTRSSSSSSSAKGNKNNNNNKPKETSSGDSQSEYSEDELLVDSPSKSASTKKSNLKVSSTRKIQKRKPSEFKISKRSIPLDMVQDKFGLARQKLHVAAVPETLPCRENEFQEIYSHLESSLREAKGTCLYISGVPGTGKTATVHEVVRSLQNSVKNKELNPFQFVEINGMKITEPSQSYTLLLEALCKKKVTPSHAAQLLEKRFSTYSAKRAPCIVLMDELDLLVTRKQTVMYNFFQWPNLPHSRLIVIAIANTMDLPERMLTNKVSSRLGLIRLAFEPYNHHQLIKIVHSRLEGNNAFDPDAIELCARKVSAVSGDARRALDICRRAVEMVETSKSNDDSIKQVTRSIIDKAIKEMFATPSIRAIQHASLQQKLFMASILKQLEKSGVGEVEYREVKSEHLRYCRLFNIEPPTAGELSSICATLFSVRCILVDTSRSDFNHRIKLNVSEEDVLMALRNCSEEVLKRVVGS